MSACSCWPRVGWGEAVATDLPELVVLDAAEWRTWLLAHQDSPGVWLLLAKKGTREPTSLTHDEALEEALCMGWIDGQSKRIDEWTFRQRFTPRTARSSWSQRNVALAQRLEDEGRMHDNGRTELERARADGRLAAAYAGPATIEVPDDLAAALAAEPTALAMFRILTSQNRYSILFRIGQAKTPQTRSRRIDTFVAMLARGETVYPQKRTLSDG